MNFLALSPKSLWNAFNHVHGSATRLASAISGMHPVLVYLLPRLLPLFQVWGLLYLILILVSVASQAMITHPMFRHSLENPRRNLSGETNTKLILFLTTDPVPLVAYAELVCVGIFSTELFTRLTVSPSKANFLKNGYNIIDIIGIVPSLMQSIFTRAYPSFFENTVTFYMVWVLAFFSVFRTLRVLKYAQQHKPVKILLLTLQASLKEQCLLGLMICISVLWYSNVIYFAEFNSESDFETIPIGFWWAIVTMTTVGYGDVSPQTPLGYLAGAACALTGLLCTGMSIPIIASKFNMYYTYAKFCMRDDKTKVVRRALNAWKTFKKGAAKAVRSSLRDKTKMKILAGTPSDSPRTRSGSGDSENVNNLVGIDGCTAEVIAEVESVIHLSEKVGAQVAVGTHDSSLSGDSKRGQPTMPASTASETPEEMPKLKPANPVSGSSTASPSLTQADSDAEAQQLANASDGPTAIDLHEFAYDNEALSSDNNV